jgi:peptidoglycan/LPS O-acetylase OafA/YrhL
MNRRFPSLNGWRAISILLVLGNHTPVIPGFPPEHRYFFTTWIDGNLGVRFFFSISGFLITWLMLAEEAEYKRVSLKNFYIRRSLRIWPVYFAYVAVSLVLQVTGRCSQSADAWRGVLTFTRNFHDETAGAPGDFVTAHLWSLSIEEQFYLFWPFIFCFIGARQRIGVLLAAIMLTIYFRLIRPSIIWIAWPGDALGHSLWPPRGLNSRHLRKSIPPPFSRFVFRWFLFPGSFDWELAFKPWALSAFFSIACFVPSGCSIAS